MDAESDFLHARYEVRQPDGTIVGPVSAWTLAVWRESRRIEDTAEVRRTNGATDSDWVMLRDSAFLRQIPDEPIGWDEP